MNNFQSINISRKSFLKGLAGVSLFPFLEINAEQNQRPPFKRMVFIQTWVGMIEKYFKPQETGANYKTPKTLQPLDHLRRHFTIFSNVDHNIPGGHHAEHAYLSGVHKDQAPNFKNKNQTLDMLAAEHCMGLTRVPMLNLYASGGIHKFTWDRAGICIKPTNDAQKVFNDLFTSDSADEKMKLHAKAKERLSTLEVLKAQERIYRKGLSKSDNSKLKEYEWALKDLEKKILLKSSWIDKSKPDPQIKMQMQKDNKTFEKSYPNFLDMVFWALYTDSTRIANLQIDFHRLEKLGIRTMYHNLSHHSQKEDVLEDLSRAELYFMSYFAKFLDRLQNTPDPQGSGTMLDNTMVLFGSPMNDGSSHTTDNLPLLLAGGGFKHGKHIKYQERMPMCNLLLTMGQNFGLEIDQFNVSTGALKI